MAVPVSLFHARCEDRNFFSQQLSYDWANGINGSVNDMDTITLPTSLDFSFLLSLDNEPLRDFDGKPIGEPLGLENSLWRAPQGVTRCVRAVDAPPVAVTCPSRSIGFRQESVGSWGQVTSHCLNAAEELLTKLSSSVATSGTGPVTASDGAPPLFAASVSALYVGTPLHDRVAKN